MPRKQNKQAKEKTSIRNIEPTEDALIAALHENWDHARHIESQRTSMANIYFLVISGLVAVLLSILKFFPENINSLGILFIGLCLLYIGAFSFGFYCIFIKHDIEFGNHIAHISWIAQKLKLNRYENIGDSGAINDEYRGYMGLPLNIPIYGKFYIFTFIPAIISSFFLSIGFYFICRSDEISNKDLKYGYLAVFCAILLNLILIYLYYSTSKIKKSSIENRKPKLEDP